MSIISKALASARTISLKKAADAVGSAATTVGNTFGQIADAARATVSNDGAAKADPTNVAYSEARTQAAQELGRINVLVAGNTGVGKSSLINAVFGENVAPTGTGMPVTDTLSLYEAPNSLTNLWDSRGFEAGDTEAVKAVDEKLAELRSQGDATAQIHVAWLCISSMSNRVEPLHLRFLKQMEERRIPTIVVFTQTYRSMPLEARRMAAPAAASIEVLAHDADEFGRKAFGLDALVEATDRVLPEARKAAFAASQRVAWALKKRSAHGVVIAATAAAVGTAVAPGHSAVLSVIQVGMLAKIDTVFGQDLLSRDLSSVKAMAGASASQGGKWLFGALLSDGLKTSGVGYVAGVAVGGAVGGAVTAAIGHAYVEGVGRYVESGATIPLGELAGSVAAAARSM